MTPAYNNNILTSFIEKLQSAASLPQTLQKMVENSGFKHFTHVGLKGFNQSHHPPPYMTNVDPAWEKHYQSANLAERDPILSKCLSGVLPINFLDLDPSALSKSHLATMSEAEDFKMNLGLSIPVHGPNNSLSILSVYHDGTERSFHEAATSLPLLTVAALHLHEHQLEKSRTPSPNLPPTTLTEREAECLAWTSQGKTAWEISAILHVSERTVKFHLNNVMRKLGVHSRTHAVARAISLGITHP